MMGIFRQVLHYSVSLWWGFWTMKGLLSTLLCFHIYYLFKRFSGCYFEVLQRKQESLKYKLSSWLVRKLRQSTVMSFNSPMSSPNTISKFRYLNMIYPKFIKWSTSNGTNMELNESTNLKVQCVRFWRIYW